MSSARTEHYQLSGIIAVRSTENSLKLHQSIELHCDSNPFTEKTNLKSVASSTVLPEEAKNDILHFAEKGQDRFEEFIHDRLLPTSPLSVWDPMKKLKLKTFSNSIEKTQIKVGDKVIKLREERELLGSILIIQGTRPELVPKLEETIGEYEMSVVPRSLCAVDGSLYIPTDKSALMHAVEEVQVPQDVNSVVSEGSQPHRVLIVDAMAVLQSMKKTPTTKYLSDLQDAFVKRIGWMMVGYDEGHAIFDRYLDQSLKNKTRQKRAVNSMNYELHPNMRLTMSLKELLSSTKTKRGLTVMFAQKLLEHYRNIDSFKMIVAYDTKIKSHTFEEDHPHEEADTLIPHQVLASTAEHPAEVSVWSPDTDVLILLMDLVSHDHLRPGSQLRFLTGKGTKYREINVVERVRAIGHGKCQGLIGIHNFSGADWGGKFVGITKKTWITANMKLDINNTIVTSFQKPGEGPIKSELINGELPLGLKPLEQFVCHV